MSHWPITVDEFVERPQAAARGPFSASMGLSLLAHGAIIAALVTWLQQESNLQPQGSITTYQIALSRANADHDSGAAEEFVADNLSEPLEQVAQIPIEAPPKAEVIVAEPPPSLNEVEVVELDTVPTQPTEPLEVAELEVSQPVQASAEMVATTADTWWQLLQSETAADEVAEDIPTQQSLNQAEVDMLQQQLQAWQENFDLTDNPAETYTWQSGQQIFQASLNREAPQNATDLERAIVTVSTEVDGVPMSTQMAFKRLAFSNYAQIVDRWDRDVSLSDDEVIGRFHSNSRLVVSPDRRTEPVFNGKVTVSSSVSLNGIRRRADIFQGGLETRVKPIRLPRQLQHLLFPQADSLADENLSTVDSTEASPAAILLDTDGEIELLADGGFDWLSDTQREFFACSSPCYIHANEGVEVGVKGTVNGTVLIFAEDTIQITGNIRYRQHPRDNPESRDYLGLVSENYIEVASPNVTGKGDLTIDGALYAKRRFLVRRFRQRNDGLLSIFGSLTAGSVSATEPRYATRVEFDPRFEEQRLPNFPMTDKYELEDWDKVWTILETRN